MNIFSPRSFRTEEFNLSQSFLNPGPHHGAVITAWVTLQFLGGNILCAILLMTMLISKKLKRHPTLYNVIATWAFTGTVDSML